MEIRMGAEEVLSKIQQLQQSGEPLSKKKVKQSDPELMQNALYYFPSWEHALQNAEQL
ncbi:hypothetical protein [Marinicrinis lubricantis]|uniref:Uncharacterized protein n=1 Tax=Marinicrinis lubricantis TaxID=2086470 RepID=A0ABW1IU67_9BACL